MKPGDMVRFSCIYPTLDTTTEEYVLAASMLDVPGGLTVETLHAGQVAILIHEDVWCKILHPSGKVGWVMREELGCVG